MPDPISACTVPMSYYEETPEQPAPPPKTHRQASCQAAYAACMDAAEYEAIGDALACGGIGVAAALAAGPLAPMAALASFVGCQGQNLFDNAADEAMCRSNYYRCDTGQ